jgi:hypothetical protein
MATLSLPHCILDTSVIIDLDVGGVLAQLFALPYSFAAPDVILAELQQVDGQQLLARGLQSAEFPPEQVLEVTALGQRHRNVSINDLFALVLADMRRCTLVTGDRTLWVLDEMVHHGVVAPLTAAGALERMLALGSRLPRAECERLLKRWKSI